MDIIRAFLAGDIDEEIYGEQLEGFEQDIEVVCELRKGLYDLK